MTEPITLTLPAWAFTALLGVIAVTIILSFVRDWLVWKTHKIKKQIADLLDQQPEEDK